MQRPANFGRQPAVSISNISNSRCSILVRGIRSKSTVAADDLLRKYPFPQSPNPKPHEIFHLPPGIADQAAIKSRYFELVKIHHPDSALARGVPEKIAQGRFQLLTSAYERLQNPLLHGSGLRQGSSAQRQQDKEYYDEIMRRSIYRGMGVRDMEFRRTATTAEGTANSLWRRDEGLLFIFGILVCFSFAYHVVTPTPSELARKSHERNQRYLTDARTRGKEEGMKRREEIRTWLREKRGESNTEITEGSSSDITPTSSTSSSTPELVGFGDAVSLRSIRARQAALEEKD